MLDYGGIGDLVQTVWRLRRLITRTRPRVVLSVDTAVNVVAGLTCLMLKQRPAWIACVDTNPDRRELRFRAMLMRWLFPLADALVACSSGVEAALKAQYPRETNKIQSIFYPVDFEALDRSAAQTTDWVKPEGTLFLATVGHAHQVKRWDLMLNAFSRATESRQVELICCGTGPLLESLKAQARSLKIRNRVHFPGHCTNPFSILGQADIFLLSSDAEGLPHALIEAQGLGVCAVTTRCAFGPEEIVTHGETGLLVDVGNAEQMARAMQTLLENPSLRRRMGANARKQARERFDFRNRCREWEQLVLDCADSTA